MYCPQCGASSTKVKETRTSPETTFRQRVCLECGFAFRTREEIYEGSITSHMKRYKGYNKGKTSKPKKKDKQMDNLAQEMVSKMALPKPPVLTKLSDFNELRRQQQAEQKARIRDFLNHRNEGGLLDDYDDFE